ncbi:Mitochondrial inner membrane protein OXA1-like protein [Drosera capensis]
MTRFCFPSFHMAYRRSVITRASLLSRWYRPSVSHVVLRGDGDDRDEPDMPFQSRTTNVYIEQQAQIHNISRRNQASALLFSWQGCNSVFSLPAGVGHQPLFGRYMSTSVGEGADSLNYIKDVTEVLTDKTMDVVTSQAPIANEVAVATADSAIPVAALQYLIDGVHSITGLNWWAAIALTTILIRAATLPILINQLKANSKLALIRPKLEEIRQEMKATGMDPIAVAAGQKRMNALFKEQGVSMFSPMKGIIIQGPILISFFFAISNMVEKVPSFKVGGAFWFTDLTTPDAMYALPVLAALSFLVVVECNMQDGLEGNSSAGLIKNLSRGLALLSIPLTASFPQALFCYWITSNLFSLTYGSALKVPAVRKFLALPDPTVPASTEALQVPALNQSNAVRTKPTPLPLNQSKTNPGTSSHTVLQQRIRNLEKQVKGRKKNKR